MVNFYTCLFIIKKYLAPAVFINFISNQKDFCVILVVIFGLLDPVPRDVLNDKKRYLKRVIRSDIVYNYDSICACVICAHDGSESLLA